MNRNHLNGGLIAIFPILVTIVTDFIVSTKPTTLNCMVAATALLILVSGLRHAGKNEASVARIPTRRRESRRPAR